MADREPNRLVLHFWVAHWIVKQCRPWTRKCLAGVFNVSHTTAAGWVRAAVRAGLAEAIGKRRHTQLYRTRSTLA